MQNLYFKSIQRTYNYHLNSFNATSVHQMAKKVLDLQNLRRTVSRTNDCGKKEVLRCEEITNGDKPTNCDQDMDEKCERQIRWT